ncbi:MAG: hypothetical protein IKD04_02275 [Clostridia bacterium]|nr:hypothetical protein [Clostridia bacterium]
MSVLKLKDENGNWYTVRALKGEKGDKGDKGEDGTAVNVDQTYNPESSNSQSGKAVAEAVAPFEIKVEYVENELVADKTFEEITNAIAEGKMVYVKHDSGLAPNTISPLSWYSSAMIAFSVGAKPFETTSLFHLDLYIFSDNHIEISYYEPLSKTELIYTIDEDNLKIGGATTDNAVVNYVNDKVGDIETALDSIIALQNSLMGGE